MAAARDKHGTPNDWYRIGLLWSLLVSAGCTANINTGAAPSGGGGGAGKELQGQARTHMPDVPVPVGFKLVDDRSRSYKNNTGLRWVDYLYKGRKNKLDVIAFYEKQMPSYQWTPQLTQSVQGRTALDFTKEHERCRITVFGGGTFGSTYIHVFISPGARVGPAAGSK